MRTIILIQLLSFLAFSSCTKSDDLEPNYSSETNGKTTALFNPDLTYGTVMDIDGNVYKTINIDGITWMAENLRTTKYNDGTKIPNIKNNDDWKLLQNGAYRNYMDDNNAADIATYGRLYNYYAVESGKLAPKGWRIPTQEEYEALLIKYLGSNNADKTKEVGVLHWFENSSTTSNESGLTLLPAGGCNLEGTFSGRGKYCELWTATEESPSTGRFIRANQKSPNLYNNWIYYDKRGALPVRCIKEYE